MDRDREPDLISEAVQELSTFLEGLSVNGQLGYIIQSHLIFESELDQLIEERLTEPDRVDLSNFRFNQKVELAIGLGAMPTEAKPAFLYLNTLRNRFAHNHNYSLSIGDAQKFLEKVEPLEKAPRMTAESPGDENVRILYPLVVMLNVLKFSKKKHSIAAKVAAALSIPPSDSRS